MTEAEGILSALWDDLCRPVLDAAGDVLTSEQQVALAFAPLVLVGTDPPRCGLMGFGPSGPIDCGAHDLPPRGGAAIAAFLEAGINGPLKAELRPTVLQTLKAKTAELMVTLRPDRGEAQCHLVARGDRHLPIVLFALKSLAPEVWH
jgi:hypothetical protein